MLQEYDPVQKLSVVKQTTGRYGLVFYEVEESENGYVYGLDEMVDNIYVDEVEFKDQIKGDTIKRYESTHNGESYERIVIQSEFISVKVNNKGCKETAIISWSKNKNSIYNNRDM